LTALHDRRMWERLTRRYHKRDWSGPGNFLTRREWEGARRLFDRHCKSIEGAIIDLGTGGGAFWRVLDLLPDRVIRIDIIRTYAPVSAVGSFVQADARHLPLVSCKVGCIVALGLTEYLNDLDAALHEWRRVITARGRLLLTWSPPGALGNQVRRLTKPPVYLRKDEAMLQHLTQSGWHPVCAVEHHGWQAMVVAGPV